ncbi:taurine ABC transporter permease [Jannaschia sp. EhC01]|nr:taurine ABC transporter permease [Jannaschia sp. EhC01]
MIPLLIYIAIFIGAFLAVRLIAGAVSPTGFGSLKTVTFGDESAVIPDRRASVISVLALFFLWCSFTGSILIPSFLHMPGPPLGLHSFTHTVQDAEGNTDDATVTFLLWEAEFDEDGNELPEPEPPVVETGDGFALNDSLTIEAYGSELARLQDNDLLTRDDGTTIIAVNGQPIVGGDRLDLDFGTVTMSTRGSINILPDQGLQMEPIWLPPPEDVWVRLIEISTEGFRNFTLLEHLGYSLFRVVVGFALGALVGIPLGYAMGLSNWARGWFDPIVEFMRPVPPLALIPLVIIWAGIGEPGKIVLLFLAALWIMAIAARAGVSGVNISKVHAAYSLGASKAQIMRYVIVPNSLPEIFTGARVAMGVCWGTVVAAELVAAVQGAGMMIMVASRFQNTDIVILGIILIGMIGFGIDILMRMAEKWLVPWKGKS